MPAIRRGVAASPPAILASAVVTLAIALTAAIALIALPGPPKSGGDADSGPRAGTGYVGAASGPLAPSQPGQGASAPRSPGRSGSSVPTTGLTGPAATRPTSPATTRGASKASACADVAAFRAANGKTPASPSLTELRAQFAAFAGAGADLVRDAPPDLASAAKGLLHAVNTLRPYLDDVNSVDELAGQTQSNPKLAAAFTALAAADQRVSAWAASNC